MFDVLWQFYYEDRILMQFICLCALYNVAGRIFLCFYTTESVN